MLQLWFWILSSLILGALSGHNCDICFNTCLGFLLLCEIYDMMEFLLYFVLLNLPIVMTYSCHLYHVLSCLYNCRPQSRTNTFYYRDFFPSASRSRRKCDFFLLLDLTLKKYPGFGQLAFNKPGQHKGNTTLPSAGLKTKTLSPLTDISHLVRGTNKVSGVWWVFTVVGILFK